jgi:hypothetical protein
MKRPLASLELRAELLKERIYATLALLAVLLTIDADHTSPLKAALIVAGTACSLWLAGLAAARMSYRVVMQEEEPAHNLRRQMVTHSPLLFAAAFPLLTIGMAGTGFIELTNAINLAIAASLLLLLSWSLLSARAIRAGKLSTLVLAVTELGIGLAIVSLKMVVSH